MNIFGDLNGIAAGIYQLVRQEFIDRPLPVPANDAMNVNYTAPGAGGAPRRVFDKLAEFVSVADHGGALNGVTDDAAAVRATQVRAGRRAIAFNGVAHIATPVTITSPILDTLEQIFSETSQVTIANGQPIRPEWFGSAAGNIRRAVNATPARGGVVLLDDAVYPPSYDTATGAMFEARGGTPGVDYMVKKHVKIQGTHLPGYHVNRGHMEGGSIIQGAFYVASECDGFQADGFGVDSGLDTVNSLYAGADHDGFCILQVNKAAPYSGKNVHIGRIRGLCSGVASQAHAVLIEGLDGAHIAYAEGREARFGVVNKSKNITFDTFVGIGNTGADVYFKSDVYAPMFNACGAQVLFGSATPGIKDAGTGFFVHSPAAAANTIQVANVSGSYKAKGLSISGGAGGAFMDNVKIGQGSIQECTTGAELLGGVRGVDLGALSISGAAAALYVDAATTAKNNRIGHFDAKNCVDGIYLFGKISVGRMTLDNCSGFGVNFGSDAARCKIDSYDLDNTVLWNLNRPLAGDWAQAGGGSSFAIVPDSDVVRMSGLIALGATNTIMGGAQLLPVPLRPPQPTRCTALAYNGAAWAPVEILIDTSGVISTSSYLAASGGYLNLNGCEWPMPF